jgi:DNA-binding transcriptional LysR family regulator
MLNIHHLELFYYVARHGGIMEAVRNMPYGIQQPAVSGQILQLEADLGLKLFNRRPFELTSAGKELYEFVRPFFANVEVVGERLRGGVTQTIRMAAPTAVLRDHLPDVLQRVRTQFPRLKLILRDAHQPLVEQWLERHEIDFAITVLEGRPPAGLDSEPLLQLQGSFLVPKGSRFEDAAQVLDSLARGGQGEGDRPSAADPLITLPENEALPRLFRELLAKRDLEWPPAIEVTSLELIEIYAASGFGIGLAFALPGRKPHPKLRSLPIPDLQAVPIGAIWRGKLSPLLQHLLEAFRERARFAQSATTTGNAQPQP